MTKFKIKGLSMLELLVEFGIGKNGFFSDWWRNEDFAKEKPKVGEYEIDFDNTKNFTDLSYQKQKDKLPKDFDFPHPAVLAEIILTNPNKNLLQNFWSRTISVAASRDHVCVRSSSDGFDVGGDAGDSAYSSIGVSASKLVKNKRKTEIRNGDTENLEEMAQRIKDEDIELPKIENWEKAFNERYYDINTPSGLKQGKFLNFIIMVKDIKSFIRQLLIKERKRIKSKYDPYNPKISKKMEKK